MLGLLLVNKLLFTEVQASLPAVPMVAAAPAIIKKAVKLDAKAAIIMEVRSATVIYRKNIEKRLPMASLTKLVSVLLLLKTADLKQVVTVPKTINEIGGSGAKLRPGEKMIFADLLAAAIIQSANDALFSLVLQHSSTSLDFVAEMNRLVQGWGLTNTHFANPNGFDDDEHYSTAFELALIARKALQNQLIRNLAKTDELTISNLSGSFSYHLRTTNWLLGKYGIYGLKTGTTDNAGQCLITVFKYQGQEFITVVLGSSDRWTDTVNLVRAVRG